MYDDQNTTNTMNTATNRQFVAGTPVFDAAGEKVGQVSDHDQQAGYLTIEKGWLFPKDIYVPLTAVARNDADGIYLNLYKDDLRGQQYENPPAALAGDTTVTGTAMSAGADAAVIERDETLVGRDTMAGTVNATGTAEMRDQRDIRVPVMEEELVAGKRQEEIGRVHLHKDVVEEPQTINAEVTREEVYVDRVPVQGEYADVPEDAFTEKDIDVPVMGEELVTGKRARVTDEVRLHKETVTEQQQVSDTVRKERVYVEGADEVSGADQEIDRDITARQGTNVPDTGTTDTTINRNTY